ncbi:type I methionyl aminopeptidase [Treponema endosymbiont of Eucomonympha sp.]|uniref:type I methionyl aminopeptidase n=1 Tax=Treponema endosymbiont of Eucomonympha sp. TaxID=1580831 RepID=UPI00075099DF|nr:type I methionyl aminopeptidase [Treponema endosymbiont of Eucomonympha sp.]
MVRLKNVQQIEGIRTSCRLLASLYDELIPCVTAGVTTGELDDFCMKYIKAYGGKPAWHREKFPGTACISLNNEVIHGVPGKRKIKNGDIVSLDIGVDLDGFISDSAITVPVGTVSREAAQLIDITHECLWAGISACAAGNRVADIARAVFSVAEKAGYGVVHEYCGHGVGLDVHEDPAIPNVPSRGPNPRIQAGMVLAIEPMINLGTGDVELSKDGWTVLTKDGNLSAHEEHTVAVFSDHTEVLTLRH